MDERGFRDWTDDQYKIHFRMDRGAFWRLHDKYGQAPEIMNTHLRLSIPSDKRLAVTLHWLAHGLSFQQLALLYAVGKSTAVEIVHSTIAVLKRDLVPDSIQFPEGHELQQVITDFQHLAGLPQCAGAVDGTFMKIGKPLHHGDSYWCSKKYCAIIILGTLDARGIFTNVNAGQAESAGDAATFHTSALRHKIERHKWLGDPTVEIDGVPIEPYLVGDSAFALERYIMKCFAHDNLTPEQERFNYSIIRTRRVVEQAFGRLKGRFRVLIKNNLRDPKFAADVAVVPCALHNVCERWGCPYEQTWTIDHELYNRFHPGGDDHPNAAGNPAGEAVRALLADYLLP